MRGRTVTYVGITAAVVVLIGASMMPRAADGVSSFRVVRVYPHDPQAFTQGLQFVDGVLYEGTGLNGRSEIRKVELETGACLQRRALDREYFGEGITIVGNRVIQLTWKSQVGFVYALDTFEMLRQFSYVGEGWGLTYDGENLVMSDGTASLRFLDPVTLNEVRRIQVQEQGVNIDLLNELEYVRGEVLANVWQTNRVVRIDPATGDVRGWVDLTGLLAPTQAAKAGVLNGIAYDSIGDRLFVTGKLWPSVFEIELVPPNPFPSI